MDLLIDEYEGTKFISPRDCGNSPKIIRLNELNEAFLRRDWTFIEENLDVDIQWLIIGMKQIEGKTNVRDQLETFRNEEITEIRIKNTITHGKVGSVNGTLIMDKGRNIDFCNMYTFSSAGNKAKMKEMTSYVIETME